MLSDFTGYTKLKAINGAQVKHHQPKKFTSLKPEFYYECQTFRVMNVVMFLIYAYFHSIQFLVG